MKLIHAGALATTLVIVAGVAMISPMLFRTQSRGVQPKIAIFLYVPNNTNATSWCSEIGSYLKATNTKATVFLAGDVVDNNTKLVKEFSEKVDIGSMTQSYKPLLNTTDYTAQLATIRNGKMSVDAAGNFDSKLFAAPYGAVNSDIFSQLRRTGIVADFSYDDHYNKIHNGTFITMPLKTVDGSTLDTRALVPQLNDTPTIVRFYSTTSSKKVIEAFESLKAEGCQFLNASDITGIELVNRGA
jgi:hypothetical protein